jgi:SulP family sulfate permease
LKAYHLIPEWIRQYKPENFRFDLTAGLTVGVMLIPQAMAYAMLAGIPPIYGLYASTFPSIIYGLLGSCRQLSIGPTAMISMLTASGGALLAKGDPNDYLMIVAAITVVAGLIQFALGLSRLGFLVQFLSRPILVGFTSAAAIIIGLSQVKYFLGLHYPQSQYVQDILYYLFEQISQTHLLTLAFGGVCLVLLMLLKSWSPNIPGALITMIIAIVGCYAFHLDQLGISIIGSIPKGIPHFSLPLINPAIIKQILPAAFAIALISFMESSATAQVLWSRHDDYSLKHNGELISIGLSNIMSGLLHASPVSGGMLRSTVNDQSGAKTGLATIVSATLILLTLLFLTPLFYYLPHAVLAAIILIAVYRLVRIKEAILLWHIDKRDFWMMLVAFLGTLTMGITSGIGIGVILSLGWIIFESTYPHHAELGQIPDTSTFRNVRRFSNLIQTPGVLIFRFDAPLFFANANTFKNVLLDYKAQREDDIHTIVLDMESINSIDSTALQVLEQVVNELSKQQVSILLAEVKGPVRDKLYKSGLMQKLGDHHMFVTIHDAIHHVAGIQGQYRTEVAMQTNVGK